MTGTASQTYEVGQLRIVEPYARLMDVPDREAGVRLLKKIEWCARISHRSEEAQTDDSWERFVRAVVLEHGDWSVVEHASVTIDMLVDRGITHEWVRHRLCAFTQQSTRFVNHAKKMPPEFIRPVGMPDEAVNHWWHAIRNCEQRYLDMIAHGCSPQIARSVFPNSLASRIVTTTNLRNLRHMLLMRTSKETHPQMKQVTLPLLAEVQAKIPLLFADIEPEQKQSEAMKKTKSDSSVLNGGAR